MLCRRCGNKLNIENELDYPLVCYYCDENMFIFEGIDEYEGETHDMYLYLDWVKKIAKKIFTLSWYECEHYDGMICVNIESNYYKKDCPGEECEFKTVH